MAALALVLPAACSSGNGNVDSRATVTGRLMTETGEPIGDAAVLCESAVEATTDANGLFTIRLKAGAHHLVFVKDGKILAGRCLAVAELTRYELGDLCGSTPTACEEGSPSSGDTDGDGLADEIEIAGWTVQVVAGDGTVETRQVTSDPKVVDTDGDGLSDAQEYAARTDPRRKDTDGDGLSDYAELMVYKSDPTSVDTDGDSRGPDGTGQTDPNLWDGNEVLLSHTSPTLADTDGDGLTDWEEIHSGGTNPLVADLPTLALELYGDPRISLDEDVTTSCTVKQVELSRDSTENVDTDLVSTKMSIENTVALHTEAEIGTSHWPPSANAKLTTDTQFKQAWMHDTSSSWTQTSVEEAQKSSECWETTKTDYDGGDIRVAMKLRNLSDLAFKVKDLRVIAYQLKGGGRFSVVGTLDPVDWPEGGFVLGPSGEQTFMVQKLDLGAETMKSLVRTPSALFFEVGGYSLFQLDEWGVTETVNYAKLGESVVQRTGLLTIDSGAGDIERHLIATNVYRNPDGSGRGITMREALGTLGIAYQTEKQKDADGKVVGPSVLTRVRSVETYKDDPARPGRGFWVVAGTGADFEPGVTRDFDDIVLKNGGRVSLVFLVDSDLDGIFDREEELLGTDKLNPDTDGDTLTDYEETKVGWLVSAAGVDYQVFSDPRFADADGDYLSDGTEKGARTDPYKKDTDGDGVNDTNDPDPNNPPCLPGSDLGIAAWWDGTAAGTLATDIWKTASPGDPTGVASNATMVPGSLILNVQGGPVFNLNSVSGNPGTDYMDAPNHVSLSPTRELSLSALIFRNNLTTFPALSTIVSKGAYNGEHYALYLDPTGKAAFVLTRSVHEKCWYCWFGSACDDGSCADSNYVSREVLLTPNPVVVPGEWTLLTVTFGGEAMRIYKNGAQVASASTYAYWADGWYRYETTTNYLIGNSSPLRVGVSAPNTYPFSGMLDNVQFFGKGLASGQVLLLNQLGACKP